MLDSVSQLSVYLLYLLQTYPVRLTVAFATEKSLVDCAYNLRAELENAAADVSGLFSKIGLASQLDYPCFLIDSVSLQWSLFLNTGRA
jgi:hypothetical protein